MKLFKEGINSVEVVAKCNLFVPFMQVKSRSRKFYKCYFDLIETLKTEEVYPFGVGSFCATKVFFSFFE